MTFRKLRIAWSVAWGFAIVLLCVLWARSKEWHDSVQTTTFGLQRLSLISSHGHISGTLYFGEGDEFSDAIGSSRLNKLPPGVTLSPWAIGRSPGGLPAAYYGSSTQYFLLVPHWFAISLAMLLGIFPWVSKQFSLRTLLIVTTFVAVVLGLIMWLS
jgi:hypothetical protein